MDVKKKEIAVYETPDGKTPFHAWLKNLRSEETQKIVIKRIDRVQAGNYGDCKALGGGVLELRFHIGIRVYFAEFGQTIVLLLCGGDKNSQPKDIEKAKDYWLDHKRRSKED